MADSEKAAVFARCLVVEPTLMGGEEVGKKVLADACEKARLMAKDF